MPEMRPLAKRRSLLLTKWDWVACVLGLAGVLSFFYWTAASGNGLLPLPFGPARYSDHYNLLLHGILKGQLHLDVPVDPAMLTAANPYDPQVWIPHGWMVDASFYNGKYYIYYGIVPLLVFLLPFRLLTGSDLWLATAAEGATVLAFLALVWFCLRVRRDYFPRSGSLIVFAAILALGFTTALPALARRPMMYEFSIATGCFFATLMLHCAYSALVSERRRTVWMAMAGLCLGLAFGSRPTYLFTCAAPGCVLLYFLYRDSSWRTAAWRGAESALRPVLGFALGAAVPFSGVMLYNYLRFSNPFDFGFDYLLLNPPTNLANISRSDHFWFNLQNYYTSSVRWTRYFPFIHTGPYPDQPKTYYGVAEVYGVLRYLPVLWFMVALPLALRVRTEAARGAFGLVALMVFLSYVGPGTFLLTFGTAFPRYEADFRPQLILLAIFGAFALDRALASTWAKRAGRVAWLAAALVSAGIAGVHSIPLSGHMTTQKGVAYYERVARTLNYPVFLYERARDWRYGAVTWQATFPSQPAGTQEKLIETPNATLVVEYLTDGKMRFGLKSAGEGGDFTLWGEGVEIAAGGARTLSASFGSLYPTSEHPYYLKHQPSAIRSYSVTVMLDGRTVLQGLRPLAGVKPEDIQVADGAARPGWFSGQIEGIARNKLTVAQLTPDSALRTVRLEVPTDLPAGRWPVIAAGAPEAGDILFIEVGAGAGGGGDTARWGYFSTGAPVRHGPEFPLARGRPLEATVRMEALEISGRTPGPRRALVIEVDGRVTWSTQAEYHPSPPETVQLGANTVAAPGVEAAFPGAIQWRDTTARALPTRATEHLFLRVVFPPQTRWGQREPLLITGVPGAYAGIQVVYYGDGLGRFALDHNRDIGREGPVIPIRGDGVHDIEIITPAFSLYRDDARAPARGTVVVKMDGAEVGRFELDLFPAQMSEVQIGENSFGGPAEPQFGGAVLMKRWAEAPAP